MSVPGQVSSYPIEALLPHARPMILIDQVLRADAESLEAALTVRSDMPFYESGKGVAAHISIEWMAQACGAYVGLEALKNEQPVRLGFLLGTRNFTAVPHWFTQGESLVITARVTFRDGDTAVFDCTVCRGDVEAARASLTVHQPRDIDTILAKQGVELRP